MIEDDPARQADEFRKNTSKLAAKLDKQGRKEKEGNYILDSR